jgi:mannose-1-phosphate guanylyltransferase / phosphomannomutase
MKAVILAGGKGEDLLPMTLTRPKPLMLVLNQPILERIIEALPKAIDEVFVTTDFMADKIKKHFQDPGVKKRLKGRKVKIIEEERPLGTAGSIKALEHEIRSTFLVLQSDVVSTVDYFKMLEFHKERKATVTMSTFRVRNPLEYGILGVDQEGRIMKFLEKPKIDQVFSTMVNAGAYVCEPSIFEEIPHHGICDFSNDVFPRLIRKGEFVAAFEFKGMWTDIGSFQNYLDAHKQLLERSMMFSVQSKSAARTIPPLLIGEKGKIGAATIGPDVCIADKVTIGKGAKLYESVIYDNVKIGDGCIIKGSVIGSGVTIGKGAVIMDAMLGDGVVVKNGVKVGSFSKVWPKKKINKDVPEKEWVGFLG